MLYFDYNATTPVDSQVYQVMIPYFTEEYGNPSNLYALGKQAKEAVLIAREQVARLIGANSDEITFTSCGSESNNMVIKGVAYQYQNKGKHIITSTIEHPSIIEPLAFLEKNGYSITRIPVNSFGIVSAKDVEEAIRPDTILVTIMHANNEVGSLQPIEEIGKLCKEKDVLFHTDSSQSMGKIPIDVQNLQVDFLTLAGHKLYAPKGIGALFIRNGISIEPLIHGANQESKLRAGTENVPYMVGLGEAALLAMEHLNTDTIHTLKLYFLDELTHAFGDAIHVNGSLEDSLPNTLNVSFVGYSGADILAAIPELCASTGSACHAGTKAVSPVLSAMKVPEEIAYGAIRFSLGRFSTKAEIDQAIVLLKQYVL